MMTRMMNGVESQGMPGLTKNPLIAGIIDVSESNDIQKDGGNERPKQDGYKDRNKMEIKGR